MKSRQKTRIWCSFNARKNQGVMTCETFSKDKSQYRLFKMEKGRNKNKTARLYTVNLQMTSHPTCQNKKIHLWERKNNGEEKKVLISEPHPKCSMPKQTFSLVHNGMSNLALALDTDQKKIRKSLKHQKRTIMEGITCKCEFLGEN